MGGEAHRIRLMIYACLHFVIIYDQLRFVNSNFEIIYIKCKQIRNILTNRKFGAKLEGKGVEMDMSNKLEIYNNLYSQQERKELIAMGIKAYREGKGLSQKEVAEALGINVQTYAAYERGRNEAPAEILVRLSLYYDVSLDVLMQRDNMAKDKLETSKQLDNAQAEIAELQKMLANKDENTQEQIGKILDSFSSLADILKGLNNQ